MAATMHLRFDPSLPHQQDAINRSSTSSRGCRWRIPRFDFGTANALQFTEIRRRQHACRSTRMPCSQTCTGSRTETRFHKQQIRRAPVRDRDGNWHRQDLRLPAHDLRAAQAVRAEEVRDRGASVPIREGVLHSIDTMRGALSRTVRRAVRPFRLRQQPPDPNPHHSRWRTRSRSW